jgi:hypothetical protein
MSCNILLAKFRQNLKAKTTALVYSTIQFQPFFNSLIKFLLTMVLSTEKHVFISVQRLSERTVEETNVEEKTTSLHDRRGYMPEELILYIDIRKIPRSQTSSCVSNFG